jgi:hypothetical protein
MQLRSWCCGRNTGDSATAQVALVSRLSTPMLPNCINSKRLRHALLKCLNIQSTGLLRMRMTLTGTYMEAGLLLSVERSSA